MNGERESITNGKSKFLTLPGAAGEVAGSLAEKVCRDLEEVVNIPE